MPKSVGKYAMYVVVSVVGIVFAAEVIQWRGQVAARRAERRRTVLLQQLEDAKQALDVAEADVGMSVELLWDDVAQETARRYATKQDEESSVIFMFGQLLQVDVEDLLVQEVQKLFCDYATVSLLLPLVEEYEAVCRQLLPAHKHVSLPERLSSMRQRLQDVGFDVEVLDQKIFV